LRNKGTKTRGSKNNMGHNPRRKRAIIGGTKAIHDYFTGLTLDRKRRSRQNGKEGEKVGGQQRDWDTENRKTRETIKKNFPPVD